jgi:hypothetical protein
MGIVPDSYDLNDELQRAMNGLSEDALFELTSAVIRKSGSQWCIFSKNGKRLECFPTRKEAVKRLRQIEFFKNRGDDEDGSHHTDKEKKGK